jgi:hypothetical protein
MKNQAGNNVNILYSDRVNAVFHNMDNDAAKGSQEKRDKGIDKNV